MASNQRTSLSGKAQKLVDLCSAYRHASDANWNGVDGDEDRTVREMRDLQSQRDNRETELFEQLTEAWRIASWETRLEVMRELRATGHQWVIECSEFESL